MLNRQHQHNGGTGTTSSTTSAAREPLELDELEHDEHRRSSRLLCGWNYVRACPELCRSEGFMLRNEDTPLQVEMYLVCSAVTILLIRVGLYATGYPQLGGDGIHIAHMLWGGLMMFVSQMLTFAFLGRHIQRLASIIGGIGFGTFIDELGKFITSDNDYFFKPTPFILYIGFCILFLVLKCVEPLFNPSRFSRMENLANALNLLSVYSTAGLSKESRLLLIELLENSDQDHPIIPHLKEYVHLPISASGVPTSREHYYLRFRKWIGDVYARFVRLKYTTYCINSFFILQCMTQILDLTYLMLDGSYYRKMNNGEEEVEEGFMPHFLASPLMKFLREIASGKLSDTLLMEETDHVTKLHIFQLVAVSISALCVICGVYYLSFSCGCRRGNRFPKDGPSPNVHFNATLQTNRKNRRMQAFIWFRRSMLVRLFITDSLALYHSQFRAIGDVFFTISIVSALSFMITQEESTDRYRRLSASGSLDEIEMPSL